MHRRLAGLILLGIAALAVHAQKNSAPAAASPAPASSAASGLASARSLLSKTAPEGLASALESLAFQLTAHEAVSLYREFLPAVPAVKKVQAASFSGALALAAGRAEDAAFLYLQGAAASPELHLRAVRCLLSIGRLEEAALQIAAIPDRTEAKSWDAERTLCLAWLHLLAGEGEKAFVLLKPLAAPQTRPELRREALLLIWMLADFPGYQGYSPSTKGWSAEETAQRIKADYPGSPEALQVQQGIVMKPSSWLLSGLSARPPERASGSDAAEKFKASEMKNELAPDERTVTRLQVGWFSRKDNAASLSAKLALQDFAASVEEQAAKDGTPRWAVIVEARGDWSRTQARLKDAGYESYLLP
jgi:hypothetical protein